jgi:toxin CcdB
VAQFDVYENTSPDSKETVPYLLDVQHDLLKHLKTRVVIPIVNENMPITHLNPIVQIEEKRWMLSTQEMAGIPIDILGKRVISLMQNRDDIVHAIDFMITGF